MLCLDRVIPSDQEVIRLLHSSVHLREPRVAAAVTMLLSLGLGQDLVRQLRWLHVQKSGSQLQIGAQRRGAGIVPITRLLRQQLVAIGIRQPTDRIFTKPSPAALSLDALFKTALLDAGLSRYRWHDFLRWSDRQSTATKLQVATLWNGQNNY